MKCDVSFYRVGSATRNGTCCQGRFISIERQVTIFEIMPCRQVARPKSSVEHVAGSENPLGLSISLAGSSRSVEAKFKTWQFTENSILRNSRKYEKLFNAF